MILMYLIFRDESGIDLCELAQIKRIQIFCVSIAT